MRDVDVRNAVLSKLHAQHLPEHDTLVVEEMGVWANSARIDVAVINGELVGFELKSDRDNLDRLPKQIEIYSKVFDRIQLVVGAKHLAKASKMLPEWWGITVAHSEKNSVALADERAGASNPSPDAYLVAHLLTKSETIGVLERHGLAKGWRSRPASETYLRLASELPFQVVAFEVRQTLKNRDRWLRKHGPNQLYMAVDRQTNPVRQPLRGFRPVSY